MLTNNGFPSYLEHIGIEEVYSILKRHHLSKKERRSLARYLRENYGVELAEHEAEYVEENDIKGYMIDGMLAFIRLGDRIIPTLNWLLRNGHCFLAKIVVDMGAVRPVSSGANVMAPGIVDIRGEFEEGDIVVVIDEKHGAPLAVGAALTSSNNMRNTGRGAVVKNLHHVGDKYWKMASRLK